MVCAGGRTLFTGLKPSLNIEDVFGGGVGSLRVPGLSMMMSTGTVGELGSCDTGNAMRIGARRSDSQDRGFFAALIEAAPPASTSAAIARLTPDAPGQVPVPATKPGAAADGITAAAPACISVSMPCVDAPSGAPWCP